MEDEEWEVEAICGEGGSECYISKRWHETRVDWKISFTMDQKILNTQKEKNIDIKPMIFFSGGAGID